MNSNRTGFTVVEVLMVVLILGLIMSTTISMFSGIKSIQTLEKDTENIASYLEKARNQTINAKNNSVFSVRIASTTVTLFEGATFVNGSSTNQVYTLTSGVVLQSYTFNPATTTITFQKMTGKPSATGTIMYRLSNNASSTKAVTIHGSGLIEVR